MSIVTKIVDVLKDLDPTQINAEIDRNEKVAVSSVSIDPLDSIEEKAVVVEIGFTRKDGSAHTIKIQTQFQRHDDDNRVSVDGKEMTDIIVDPDLMTSGPQLEFRYNDPTETPGETAPDQEVTFVAGGGNHEFRILA